MDWYAAYWADSPAGTGRRGCQCRRASVAMEQRPPRRRMRREDDMAGSVQDELELVDRWWRAANYLSVGQIYLRSNPLLREPLARGGHQVPAPGPLGHHARAELCLRPPEPGDPPGPAGDAVRRRSRPRRARGGGQRLARGHLLGDLRPRGRRRGRAWQSCSASFPTRAAFPATRRPRRPAPSARAANSGTRWRTPTGRCSTIPS